MILGIGLDLVTVDRVDRMLERHGDRFLRRCFAPGELRRPEDAEHLAGLLAAKEAGYKALHRPTDPLFGWRDMQVTHATSGRPELGFHGRAALAAADRGLTRAHLTITHHGGLAAAMVVLEGPGDGGG